MTIFWMTTAPNPFAPQTGPDQGQRGWRVHASEAAAKETGEQVRRRRAACGLLPNHGWDVDLFIVERCRRCLKVLQLPETESEHVRTQMRREVRELLRRDRG